MSEIATILGKVPQFEIRTGTIIVGNIGLQGFQNLSVSGSILSATKNNGYTERDAFIDFTYKQTSYMPRVFVSCIHNPIASSTTNDIFQHTLQQVTFTGSRIYLEKNNAADNMGIILYIMLTGPDLV